MFLFALDKWIIYYISRQFFLYVSKKTAFKNKKTCTLLTLKIVNLKGTSTDI